MSVRVLALVRTTSRRARRLGLESLEAIIAPASVFIDSLPAYGSSGLVRGHVTGLADPTAYRVALYIYVEGLGWYTKPTFANSTVAINTDGTFSANVITGGLDADFTLIKAVVVPTGTNPPAVGGAGTVPQDPNAVAVVDVERYGHPFEWRGLPWAIKDGRLPVGPNANYFSSDPTAVHVDAAGDLHLEMTFRNNHWWGAEVIMTNPVGPGTFVIQTATNFNTLDKNVTAGFFTWDAYGDDATIPSWPYRELDIEHSDWGVDDPTDSQWVVQPWNQAGNLGRFTIGDQSADPALTQSIRWQPDRVAFTSLRGYQDPFNYPAGSLIHAHEYQHDPAAQHLVPPDGREKFRFNLWRNTGTGPSDGQPVDLVIRDFAFIPEGVAPLTVTIEPAPGQLDPTGGSVEFAVRFNRPVTGFEAADVNLADSSVGGTLSAAVSGAGADYRVIVTGMTGEGRVVARVPSGCAADADGVLNLFSTNTNNAVTFDDRRPGVTLTRAAGQPDPTNAAPVVFTATFTEPVTGFDGSDVSFAGSTVGGDLAAAVTPTGPASYAVAVSGMTGGGTVVVGIPGGAATDPAGNPNTASTGTGNIVAFDAVAPMVTIDATPGQGDPTGVTPVTFDVAFSEPVVGFDAADVELSASTADGPLTAAVAQIGPTSYRVSVSEMTSRGTVVASIRAGAAADAAGNPSAASTSTDNEVEYLNAGVLSVTLPTVNTTEGAEFDLVVSRAGGSQGEVSVTVAAIPGAAAAADFTVTGGGLLTWPDGDATDRVLRVRVADDAANEGREGFAVVLSNATGGAVIGSGTAAVSIAPSDGRVIDAAATSPNRPLAVFTDADSDRVTVRLAGREGTATVYQTDPDGDGRGPIEWIELGAVAPTNPLRSGLTVAVSRPRGGTGDGRTTLAGVTGTGLKALTAPTTNLIGTGIHPTGWLGFVRVGDIGSGADVTLTGAPPAALKRPGVRITAGVVGDGTDVTVVNAPLTSLRAVSFGDGTIAAPAVGAITITGRVKTRTAPAVPGNFDAVVVIDGSGVGAGANALGSFRVGGTVRGSAIQVAGSVGAVRVGSFVDSSLLLGAGGAMTPGLRLGSFTATGPAGATNLSFVDSTIGADRIGTVTLKSVGTTRPDQVFGVTAGVSLGGLRVAAPAFRYDAGGPTPQGLSLDPDGELEFEVRVG